MTAVRYLLNSAVLTGYGSYHFDGPLTAAQARAFVEQPHESAIGHAATALRIGELLGIRVAEHRHAIRMQPGDEALVFRLLERPPEGSILSLEALRQIPCEFGLLRYRGP